MTTKKILSISIVLMSAFIVLAFIALHGVGASTSTNDDREITGTIGDDDLKNQPANDDDKTVDNYKDDVLVIGLSAMTIIILVGSVAVSLNKKNVKSVIANNMTESLPLFKPVYENYDHTAWDSTICSWSKVNDQLEPSDQPGPDYGSYKTQFQTLYNSGYSPRKYHYLY